MRVLMVTPTYYPSVGGIETFIDTITKKLNEIGVNVDIMVFSRNSFGQPLWAGGIEDTGEFKIIRVPAMKVPEIHLLGKEITPFKAYLQMSYTPKLSYIKLTKNYDILHFHDEDDLTMPFLSFPIKRPKIFHFHTLHVSLPYLKKREKFICRLLLRKTFAYSMVNSEYYRKLLGNIGIPREKILVIPNVIDLNKYTCSKPEYVNSQNIKKILYMSRLSFEKLPAIENVIMSAQVLYGQMPRLEILIAGTGAYYSYVKKMAEKINKKLDKNVIKVLGKIDEDEKIALMSSCDIVIGASRVVLEAMALGKPVIVTGDRILEKNSTAVLGGIVTKEKIDEFKYYNFQYTNHHIDLTPENVANEILKLLNDEEYMKELGEFGRKFVEKEYNADKVAKKLEKIYESLHQ